MCCFLNIKVTLKTRHSHVCVLDPNQHLVYLL